MYKRDYSREWELEKKRISLIRLKLEKEKAEKFREKLQKEGKNVSEFLKEKIDEFLESWKNSLFLSSPPPHRLDKWGFFIFKNLKNGFYKMGV